MTVSLKKRKAQESDLYMNSLPENIKELADEKAEVI